MIEPVSGVGPTVLDPSGASGASASGAPGEADERLAAGARAGDYEVERFLGAGAMGDVYAGAHKLIGKRVAIKVIKRRLAASAEAVERFLREARAANQVGHPNVVDVFALGRLADGRLYLVMDLLDGEPMSARLRGTRVAPADALALLGPVAGALDAAHERGVVHRDLKPDNIFVSGPPDSPLVHVLDFGIAKLLSSGSGSDERPETLTAEGTWLGTPAYMAPEQWSADGAGPASDRYAFGVIAYQMLAGEVPFRAGSLPAMMEKHFRAAVPSLATGQGALPPAVDEVLAKAMAKDPEARFASAAAMVAALAGALGTARGGIAKAAAHTIEGRRVSRRAPRAALIAGGALAAGALVAGAWMVTHDHPGSAGAAPGPGPFERVEVLSTPAGASVRQGDRDVGVTPVSLDVGAGGDAAVTISKPGYAAVTRHVHADERIAVVLAPVRGFEGTWAMSDGALRAFERRDRQVAAFSLDRADGPRRLLRMYEFAPADADGETVFTASEEHIDERAPDEPSCHVDVQAEYHYRPAGDVLEVRRQRARYDLTGGRCVVHAIEWSDREPLRRIGARAPDWTEATGASGPKPLDLQQNDAPVGLPLQDFKNIPQQKTPKKPKAAPAPAPVPAPVPPQSQTQSNAKDPTVPEPNAPDRNAPPQQPLDNAQGKPIDQQGKQPGNGLAHQAQQLAPQAGN